MKIKNKLINYYTNFKIDDNIILTTLFGGSLIGLIIWNRLLRIRLPRDLAPIELGIITLIISSLFILYISLFFYYLLKWYQIIPRKESRFLLFLDYLNEYIKRKPLLDKSTKAISLIVQQHFIYGPHRIYDKLYTKNATIAFYMNMFINFLGLKLNKYLWVLPKNQWALVAFYGVIFFIPRIIPAIFFFIEVIWYQHLHCFYKSLFLLLIPLLMDIILFLFRNCAENQMDYIRKFYDVENIISGKDYTMVMKKKDVLSDKEFMALYKTEEDLGIKWINYMKIYNIAHQIEMQKEHYKYFLKIPCYALFAISFFFYFMILEGIYDKTILSVILDTNFPRISLTFKKMNLFQIISINLVLCFIIIRFLFYKSLRALYDYIYIYVKITGVYYFVSDFMINYNKYMPFYYILLFFVPYMISIITYIIESYIFDSIYYFYLSLYLLIVPQIIHLILYIIQHHTKDSLDYYGTFFLIEQDPKTKIVHITYKHLEDQELLEESKDFDPEVVIQNWLFFTKVLSIYNVLQMQIKRYNNILLGGVIISILLGIILL
jgi:hypothetical protein